MVEEQYDVVVIGLGSAGSRAAAEAHKAGAKVLAIEGGEKIGGLCILRGCMPTKSLLEAAHVAHVVKDARRFGVEVSGDVTVDFAFQMLRMRDHVERFRKAKERGVRGVGYEIRMGRPRFVDPHCIDLDGGLIRAKSFVISTGSKVAELPCPVGAGAIINTSDDMFLLEKAPASAVVLGVGPVGMEFAQWLARMGTEVFLINRSRIASRVDPEIGQELTQALSQEMEVIAPALVSRIEPLADRRGADGGCCLHLELENSESRILDVDLVLNALGRVPDFEGLLVEKAGLVIERGKIALNRRLQTIQEHIFVAGDAVGEDLILHVATTEGAYVGRNAARIAGLLDGELEAWDPEIPPVSVIFTDPPLACVGESIKSLEKQGRPFLHASKRFAEQGRGITMGTQHGCLRLLAEPGPNGSGRILGCQIVGPRADDLIQVVSTAMRLGATASQFLTVPWYHPTLAESFVEVARSLVHQSDT
jgi:pyruvate/2-oxoglutarate dehydrogenase complex dihydrolipoamide dehydrogenase (E3) component